MTDKKIFVVTAENKSYYSNRTPINWFPTEEEALEWVEKFGNKKNYWFEVEELVSFDGHG